jgi:UDP-N-acetylmuramate dehydrogenase
MEQIDRDRLKAELEKIVGVSVRVDVSAKDLTTLAIGGPLSIVVSVETLSALISTIELVRRHHMPLFFLGKGSNLLIADAGFPGAVIRLDGEFRSVDFSVTTEDGVQEVTAGGGASLMNLSRESADRGLLGLGFAGGIPASLGGAVRMNAGAHGGEMADVISWVEGISDGVLKRHQPNEIDFKYRRCSLPSDCLVTRVGLVLRQGESEEARRIRAECLEERRARQPLTVPSAGSIFKNPSPTLSAGRLIEEAGCKGMTSGDVEISSMHANWIVNPRKIGRASDVMALIERVQERVLRVHGVALETEIVRLG